MDPTDRSINLDEEYTLFRSVARSLWNSGFSQNPDYKKFSYQLAFQRVAEILFQIYIFGPTKIWHEGAVANPTRFPITSDDPRRIRVVARHSGATIRMSASTEMNFEPLAIPVGDRPHCFRFIQPFDWDQLGIRDYRHIIVLVESWTEHEECIGRIGMVDVDDCSVVLENPDDLDPGWVSQADAPDLD